MISMFNGVGYEAFDFAGDVVCVVWLWRAIGKGERQICCRLLPRAVKDADGDKSMERFLLDACDILADKYWQKYHEKI